MKSLVQDLRYAIRQLLKSPGFALTSILSLACGIAATSAVFSVVWGVVMNPYPYAAPDRMVHFTLGGATAGGYQPVQLTASQWKQLRQIPAIEDSILLNFKRLTITGSDLPEDVQGTEMTSNAFNFFGVPALLGRTLLPSDAIDGHDPPPIVVLGYKFWQRRFNGDPAIIGKTIQFDHLPYNVVGVAAKRFVWNDADIYLPSPESATTSPNSRCNRSSPSLKRTLRETSL
jgi:MacB-like periplasmic core domain